MVENDLIHALHLEKILKSYDTFELKEIFQSIQMPETSWELIKIVARPYQNYVPNEILDVLGIWGKHVSEDSIGYPKPTSLIQSYD